MLSSYSTLPGEGAVILIFNSMSWQMFLQVAAVSTCAWNHRAADVACCDVSIIFVKLSHTFDYFSLLRLSNSTMIAPLTTLLSFVLTASCHSMTTLPCRTHGSRILTRGSENIKANDIDGLGCWNWFLTGAGSWVPSLSMKEVKLWQNQKASATGYVLKLRCEQWLLLKTWMLQFNQNWMAVFLFYKE